MRGKHRRRPGGRRIASIFYFSCLVTIFTSVSTVVLASPVQVLHQGAGLVGSDNLARPLGIFFDRHQNECYVADSGNNRIVIFDENGMPVYRFYHHVTRDGERRLGEPKNIVVDETGRIFVTDGGAPYLDVMDHMGRQLATIDPPEDMCEGVERFEYLALGPDNRVYATLSCRTARLIVVIHPDLFIERLIRLRPEEPSEICITAMTVDASGNIYVTDPCAPVVVQIYDSEGAYLNGFGQVEMGVENFSFPAGVVVMESGDVWIVDSIRAVASCFSSEGEFQTYIGGKGNNPGAFDYPSGLSTDGRDRLFVVERVGNRYQCFRVLTDPMGEPENQ